MSWREEYMSALAEREEREKCNYELIDAYTRLADRAASLQAEKALRGQAGDLPVVQKDSRSPDPAQKTGAGDQASPQLRIDLAEALRAKGQLQSRLKVAEEELERNRSKIKADAKLIRDLTSERAVLAIKVKDRDEELKGKAKLLEEVQDEMISLNLQVNVSERKAKELKQENKDLVDRWMARMGQEAEAMNEASRFS